jgi:hypothetical protein
MIFVLLIVSAITIYGTLTAIYYIPSSIDKCICYGSFNIKLGNSVSECSICPGGNGRDKCGTNNEIALYQKGKSYLMFHTCNLNKFPINWPECDFWRIIQNIKKHKQRGDSITV